MNSSRMRSLTLRTVRAAVVAALYAALTLLLAPISFGPIQFRVSEALVILPLIFPEAIVGVTVGCLISNFVGGYFLDAGLGTLATLIAAILTYLIGRAVRKDVPRAVLGIIPPILCNAVIIPFVILYGESTAAYWSVFATVGGGEAVVMALIGLPLYFAVARLYRIPTRRAKKSLSDVPREADAK